MKQEGAALILMSQSVSLKGDLSSLTEPENKICIYLFIFVFIYSFGTGIRMKINTRLKLVFG